MLSAGGLNYSDMPAVRAIVRDAARHDDRFSSLIAGIVHSTQFQMRINQREDAGRPPLEAAVVRAQ